jgi:hypothetical protein
MKPPIKNLIGGVKELHTREYLLKISARMVGCRERSKIASKNSKNARAKCRTRVFGERRRRRKETHLEVGPVGPRRPVGAARGQAAPAGRLGHWWPPLVSPRCLWVTPGMEIFIFIFLEFF